MKGLRYRPTLTESLAGALVLALGLTLLGESLLSSLAITHHVGERRRAAAWGQAMLAQRLQAPVLQPGVSRGDLGDGYRWRLEVRPWQIRAAAPAAAAHFYRLDLTVRWGDGADPQVLRLRTLRPARVTGGY